MISAESGRKRTGRWTIWISGISFFMLSILVLAQPSSAMAFVTGTVMDQVGNPLEGANVTVKLYDDTLTLMDTRYCDATDVSGYYQVIFGGNPYYEPEVGDKIEVTATYVSEPPATNFTIISALGPTYTVNVTISSIVIPEFGLESVGLPVAIMGIVAVFIVIGRRKTRQ